MSVASTLPGHAGRIFGGLQSGGASRADANLEGGAVKAWLEETCLVVECARSLDAERHSQTPGHGLPFWPLRLLLCEIGWLQVPCKPLTLLLQNFASQQHRHCWEEGDANQCLN